MSDLDALIRDLGKPPVYVGPAVKKALEVTAFKMKDSWRDAASGPSGSHASAYPSAIDYDVRTRVSKWEAEIGPSLGRKQGALGILEEAPGGVSAAPQNVRSGVVSENEADFERGMDMAAQEALRKAGL